MDNKLMHLKRLWYLFSRYKLRTFLAVILMIISGFMDVINLAALYPIINFGLNINSTNPWLERFNDFTNIFVANNPFMASCFVLLFVSIINICLKICYHFSINKLMVDMTGDMHEKIFKVYANEDYGFYVNQHQGSLIYAGTMAPEKTYLALISVVTLVSGVINLLCLFSLLMLLSLQGTCLILLMGGLYTLITDKVMKKFIFQCAQKYVSEREKANIYLNEFITGFKSIKIFLTAKFWHNKYNKAITESLKNNFIMKMGKVFPEMFIKFLFFVLIAMIGLALSQKPAEEILSLLPLFGTFGVVLNRLLPYVNTVGGAIMGVAEYLPDVKIVYNLISREKSNDDHRAKNELTEFKNNIKFNQVSFSYDSKSDYVLQNISFLIPKCKMTALVGLSGSGKTTIINLLLRLYSPENGTITIDDQDIYSLSDQSYLGRIGYVSQETFIYHASIRDNICFGMENCTDEMLIDAAKLAHAHDFISETSDGYDTIVGDAGIKLSGGQRQRIAIARAMLRKPEIFLFDEATSSLDNLSEKRIQKAIEDISKNTTVLVIAHRLSTVQHADNIIILEKGKVKEQGAHSQLMKNKDLYYALQQSQIEMSKVSE